MANDVNETKAKTESKLSTTKQAADTADKQPATKDKNQERPLTKAGCVWKMIAGLLTMAASFGVFVMCAAVYPHHYSRSRDMLPYIFLFFAIGLGAFFGGLVSLIKLSKKPSNDNASTPNPPREENKNCGDDNPSCDSDANSCNINTTSDNKDSKDFTDNKHTNKQ